MYVLSASMGGSGSPCPWPTSAARGPELNNSHEDCLDNVPGPPKYTKTMAFGTKATAGHYPGYFEGPRLDAGLGRPGVSKSNSRPYGLLKRRFWLLLELFSIFLHTVGMQVACCLRYEVKVGSGV